MYIMQLHSPQMHFACARREKPFWGLNVRCAKSMLLEEPNQTKSKHTEHESQFRIDECSTPFHNIICKDAHTQLNYATFVCDVVATILNGVCATIVELSSLSLSMTIISLTRYSITTSSLHSIQSIHSFQWMGKLRKQENWNLQDIYQHINTGDVIDSIVLWMHFSLE